jgi:AraC-like DNA-binding protein
LEAGYQRPIAKYLGSVRTFLDTPTMDWRIKKLKEFIDANIENAAWNFDEVCQQLHLGISVYQASRLFGRSIGIGLRRYTTRQRFERAAEKLRDPSRSIKEIAADFGYQWPEDFARGFKKEFRLSPTEYRQLCRSVEAAQSRKRSSSPARRGECLLPATKRPLRRGTNGKPWLTN